MAEDPVQVAASLVDARFPAAHAAFLGGSAITARRTPRSDLDVVVVIDGSPAPFRETTRHSGQLVEWFVNTPDSLRHYWRQDALRRRTPLLRMVAEGVPLIHAGGAAEAYQAEAVALLAAGPAAPSGADLDYQRYLVTDLLDDLRGCSDPVETGYLAATLVLAASDLLLLAGNRWSARGEVAAPPTGGGVTRSSRTTRRSPARRGGRRGPGGTRRRGAGGSGPDRRAASRGSPGGGQNPRPIIRRATAPATPHSP